MVGRCPGQAKSSCRDILGRLAGPSGKQFIKATPARRETVRVKEPQKGGPGFAWTNESENFSGRAG